MNDYIDDMALTPEQQMEQQLCSYLFGELEGSELAHVEQRLAESETWRAAYGRLRGTIELVRGTMVPQGSADSLSDGALATLAAAAQRGAHRGLGAVATKPRTMRYFMPVAAGLTVALGGVWAWRYSASDRAEVDGGRSTYSVAQGPESKANVESRATLDGAVAGVERDKSAGKQRSERDLAKVASRELSMGVEAGTEVLEEPIEALQESLGKDERVALQLGESPPIPRFQQAPIESPLKEQLTNVTGVWDQVPVTPSLQVLTIDEVQPGSTSSVPGKGGAYRGVGDVVPSPGAVGGGPSTPGPRGQVGAAGTQAVARPELAEAGKSKAASPEPAAPAQGGNERSRGLENAAPGTPVIEPADAEMPSVGFFFDDAADGDSGLGRFDLQEDAESPHDLEVRLRQSMEARAKERYETIVHSCRPLPKESPRDMYFRFWGDNPFVYTSTDQQATFAADVDTASYTLARKYLVGGNLPTKEQVRTEEFVNYFAGDIMPPSEETFAVTSEAVVSPFGGSDNRYMLRIGIRGKVVPKEERPAMALVYVVDTSGSMKEGNRMDLVKHSLRLLGTELDGRDQVGIVTFSDTAKLLLPMTSMDQRAALESAIQGLSPNGSTNVEDGMRLGYELLARVPGEGRLRRVVLISDGVANTGQTSADAILDAVRDHRKNGIYLSTVGVGMGNHNDALLERLADRGDGICDYVDDAQAAHRAMVERFSGGFIPIARDLKIQVEFDGKSVLRYRQLGFENRAVADRDFRNDAVDGGEVGSGHQVTALFELDCVPGAKDLEDLARLATVRLRYKTVETGELERVFEKEYPVAHIQWGRPSDAAVPGFQRALVAAQFAEVLRRSSHAAGDDYGMLYQMAARVADLADFAQDQDTRELRDMIRRAGELGAGQTSELSELDRTVDQYRRHIYLTETERALRGGQTEERLERIRQLNNELEQRIEELCWQEAKAGR